ncbi:hypothetical protein N658DRAFT_562827 [Parathielavia hyrcaniae]|uniref:DNA helicase n=1 Tax=Parathielavia hyrcaniae TaxID=113614 RepID=A0AAN6SVY1_9PEZI|nr:hypothetical protein N658DRAFT_562827 [Parathielavia hyrcaniae]
MTQTASPSPTHVSPAASSESGPHHEQPPSTPGPKPTDSVKQEAANPSQGINGHGSHGTDSEKAVELPTETPQSNGIHNPRDAPSVDDGPPAKRRRKKIEAKGPTTFIAEDGRRKSGRINTMPLELQPGDKRITRRILHTQQASPPRNHAGSANGHHASTPGSATAKRAVSSINQLPAKQPTNKPPPRKPVAQDSKSTPRNHRQSQSPRRVATPVKQSIGSRRSTRNLRANDDIDESPGGTRTASRIKLRVRPPLTAIPLVHRKQANLRPKLGPTFEDFFERAAEIAVEEGGLFASSEDGPRPTDESVVEDAQLILRVEKEVEPSGLLAEARCSAMSNFRKLMLLEQQRHQATAKRLAMACEAEWRRRNPQPKTAEEIELDEMELSRARWRQVNKVLSATWDNEAEEQRRVKAALNKAVNLSEAKLQARQARFDTKELTNEDTEEEDMLSRDADDLDGDSEGSEDVSAEDASEDDEDNMSSTDDEEDKQSMLSDEGLTQEQLRDKYANLPTLDVPSAGEVGSEAAATTPAPADDDTSDESIDMDDDLGTSEDESEEDDEAGSEEPGDEPSGLLGLLFGKSELKKLEAEATPEAGIQEDVDMPDADANPEPDAIANDTKDGPQVTAEPAAAKLVEHIEEAGSEAKPPSPASLAQRGEGSFRQLLPVATPTANGVSVPSVDSGVRAANAEDISMTDALVSEQLTEGEPTPIPAIQHHSPKTEPNTTAHSPSRSQSPRASDDTKPTDVETPSSTSLLHAPKADRGRRRPSRPLRGPRYRSYCGGRSLSGLYANNTNGILADEMGLGKTIQTIALLAHLACHHQVWGPHLVIVPTSVMLNWEMEFKKWCPGFKILTYYGNQEERKRKRQGWTNDDIWNVCITSYQMVLQDQQVFRRRRWHYMILDEAHNIKNFKSQRWQTLLGFNTHSRLLLTGTPLQNNLTELWSLLYFLAPPENGEGGFVDLKEFHNWFSRPESQILESGREHLDDEARAIISKLHKVLRPYLLRRLKADVEKQMPAKYEHVEFCRLSKRQRELYDGFLSRADTRATLTSGNYMSIINCLMQLRKVCNHPDLFVDRPIMTSFRMERSVAADFEMDEQLVRRTLLAVKPMEVVSLGFLNMIPTQYEGMTSTDADRVSQLSTHRILLDLREAQKTRANNAYHALDFASVKSNLVYLESAARWGRFEELQHCVYLNALRRQQRPIYGRRLVELLMFDTHLRPYKQRPKVPQKIMSWFEEDSYLLHNAIPTLQQRADSMETTITKFACVTPAVVAGDMNRWLLGAKGVQAFEEADLQLSAPIKYAPYMPKERPPDPWHEARMRLTIQFPDKRLLQYDCGKLQALDKLLRRLQAGGHRALIFTQMTKVLDILEQFLNIHGHKYLRLDGATKVEQRQILTDRFNHDPRILCFILSTRSGGLGINLTGADTVIFYDQDWNPAMDKQCQDRCHRIGQTRDVHIYRLVSEHTIEANILRKAGQKQMLDDVVIQEGEFTTDYFNKLSVRDVIGTNGEVLANEDDVAANAAMDRVLGGVESSNPRSAGRVLEQAEDKEDVAAARVAEKEIQQDEADFLEQPPPSGGASGVSSARQGTPREENAETTLAAAAGRSGLGLFAESAEDGVAEQVDNELVEHNAFGGRMKTIDDYMLQMMGLLLKDTPLDLPRDKKRSKSKKGKDTRKR